MKITSAFLHSNIFVPGPGDIKKELSVGGVGQTRVESLSIEGASLVVKVNSNSTRRSYTIHVPLTNVSHMVMASEAVTTPPLKE